MAEVTVPEVEPFEEYTVGGTPQSTFTIPPTWAFFDQATDIRAFKDGTELTYAASPSDATEFSVTGIAFDNGFKGGQIDLGGTVTNCSISLQRDVPISRTENFPINVSTLNIGALNTALSRIAAWAQQFSLRFQRAIRLADGDSDATLTLPTVALRASKYLAFDANGNVIATAGTSDATPVSSFMETVLDDADAATARTTLGLGDAAVEDVAAGGSGGLLRADGDGSSLTGISGADQTARDNTILNAMDILELQGGAVKALKNMVVDAFEDETGIDTATSTNETYDATGDYYTNVSTSQAQISQGAGTVITDMATYGAAAVAFDGTTAGNSTTGTDVIGSGTVSEAYVGKYWGAGVKKQVTGFKLWSDDERGFEISTTATSGNVTATLYGSDNGSDWTSLGSDTKADTTTTQNTFSKLSGLTAGFYRYHKIVLTYAGGSAAFGVAEVEFYENTISDMVLLTNAITAASAPDELRVVVDHEDMTDAVTVNTDLVAAVSRDGGTTWSNATLAEIRDAGSGRTVLAADVDVSAQPSGTSVKARITTANSKEQRIHKLALQADVALTV